MQRKRVLTIFLAIASSVGAIASGLLLSVVLTENPQGEFLDRTTGAIHLFKVAPLVVISFVATAAVAFLLQLAVYGLIQLFRK